MHSLHSQFCLFFVWRNQLNTPEWRYVSANAKDLVLKMLASDPDARITVDQVLNHPWLRVSNKFYPCYLHKFAESNQAFDLLQLTDRTAKICQKLT